jgi:hypothetical protein
MTSSLILIEGIPGSGKTSLARAICESLTDAQRSARWYVEEDPEHPVLPKAVRREAYSPAFSDLCLASWRAFVSRSEPGALSILEGVAFQSTVRFMYAADRSVAEIEAYVGRFVDVVTPSRPLLVYLWQRDRAAYLSEFVYGARGSTWVDKIAAYVASTPIGLRHRWRGPDGATAFWTHYGELCDRLVAQMPVATLELSVDGAQHELASTQARQWISSRVLGPAEPARPGDA